MARLISFVVLLVVFIFAVAFATLNVDDIQLNYYFGALAMPLSLSLAIATAFGVIIGVIATMGIVIRMRRKLVKLRKTIKLTEKELTNLRKLPIRDDH
ncbi:MAG: LapA family protein [Gammaproteobacteria bacterium]|nr:MAG: LapA family protein [Gammaproteobacteria bacterium]